METFYPNEIIVSILNHWANSSLYVSNFVIFCGVYLGWVMMLFLVIYILRARRYWPVFRLVLIAITSALVALFISDLIKSFYPVGRPSADLSGIVSVFTPVDNESFPSSHMAFFSGLVFVLWTRKRALGSWFFVGTIFIGVARISAGIHYPLDIIAGILLGYLVSRFFCRLLKIR